MASIGGKVQWASTCNSHAGEFTLHRGRGIALAMMLLCPGLCGALGTGSTEVKTPAAAASGAAVVSVHRVSPYANAARQHAHASRGLPGLPVSPLQSKPRPHKTAGQARQ